MLVVDDFEVSILMEDYTIIGFSFEAEMKMIEDEIGIFEDGFGTTIIDFASAKWVDQEDTNVDHFFLHVVHDTEDQ